MSERTANFHCTEGGSDKTYQLRLAADGEGYRVLTQYGPRGGRQTCGEKTKDAVPLEVAEKIFLKEYKARLAKGYKPTDEAPTQMQSNVGGPGKEDSGIRPQLLNPITDVEALALVQDDDWLMQLKHDGERCMIRVTSVGVAGINRKGEIRPLPVEVITAAQALGNSEEILLDGELIGSRFVPFDLLTLNGDDLQGNTADYRAMELDCLLQKAGLPFESHKTARTEADKREMLESARARLEEGVVFKHKRSPYRAGRPNSGGDALKLKFVESATVRVAGHTVGKRSIAMEVLEESGCWIGVGNCTVPVNYSVPAIGELVEVGYLYYMGRGGALIQPVYRGQRTDLELPECHIGQLKLKACVAQNAA